jgi:hypothetical protein
MCEGWYVLHTLSLIVPTQLLILAAGLMTAIFIFRRPLVSSDDRQPVHVPRDEAAHFDVEDTWTSPVASSIYPTRWVSGQ